MASSSPNPNDVLIEEQAALLFSSTFVLFPKSRNLLTQNFDHSKAIELCITKYFRVLDQHYDLHSFGAPTKCILKHNLKDALNEAEIRTNEYVTSILVRYTDISNDKKNLMKEAVEELCGKMKLVVERKNGRNFALFIDRIQEKIQNEFKQSLKDKLYFLFLDDPNTNSATYFGKNGKELYLGKFYYHSEVVRIVKELVYLAFIKTNQFARKLNPLNEPEMESDKILKSLENEMYAQGNTVVNQNKRNILAFREYIYNNRAELEGFLERNRNHVTLPETQKEIEAVLGTSVAQIKNVCEMFPVNNSEKLKKAYIKKCKDAIDLAVKNAGNQNQSCEQSTKACCHITYKRHRTTAIDTTSRECPETLPPEETLLFQETEEGTNGDFENIGNPADATENFRRNKRTSTNDNGQGQAKKGRFE